MLRTVGFGLFVVVALLLLPANAPVQVGYVYSDSMEPTLGVDDGYLLVPAGTVEVGDVVTFRLETRDTLVTHRVVGRTDGGFLTKGDANPSADQASGHPPVASEDVIGQVLTVGGTPLVLPNLGVAVRTVREYRTPLLGVVVGLVLLGGRRVIPRPRSRTLPRAGDVLGALTLAGFVVLTVTLLLGTTTNELAYVALADGGGPHGVLVGQVSLVGTELRFVDLPFTHRVVLVDGLEGVDVQYGPTAVGVSGLLPARPDPGVIRAHLTTARYPAVLPRAVLAALLRVHPLAAAVAVASVVTGPFVLLTALVLDGRRPLVRSRSRTRRLIGEVFVRE